MNDVPFTRLPTKLIFALDSDLLKMLAILIQQESYWIEHKKIGSDGSFYKSIQEFADIFRKKNLQDVRLMIQTLQSEGFVEILPSKGGKQANYYRINWNKVEADVYKSIRYYMSNHNLSVFVLHGGVRCYLISHVDYRKL